MTEKIDMNERLESMAGQLPEVMNALMGLHSEVVKDGALSARTKELMMVGIAVALRCEYCLWKHVPEAVRLGATREEVLEAVSTAIVMAGGPAVAYGSVVVLKILDELDV
ncbi:4-carboxymuconolactone decarboxylase [Methanosarcina sp. 2.H.T.1A.6]|uniref:carboxymuconolactone decarboxylase family protein n=1 Tax=unclassified Methanosarcina TaxID=2644672 RepID=UPI000622536F|nr:MULTISPECIES: carboxymuconolactone decarboxylase family protein [unclassified Methanosarcina]KKG14190.1 4-carboxymuconolactone decarboxylase [Methanosarcina sp. 2.H.T.1A.3]KKG15316.1 4-carboxymuconolactone decarboxylase [Methanosarcina sp. 2.H.T.1A.15]KKG19680.1 4-carboxymuconolactone decarboxylase [Methanosarcina sp. 2.H.T.1A.6]KKG24063.1 4-carboxymuconolactone decarboxylase [Methanosarcina sp. 2.H.T.1A.8]